MSTFRKLWVALSYLPFWHRLRACASITVDARKRKNRP